MKTGVASSTATGWMTSIVPDARPDPAAAPEPGEHGPDRAGHRRHAAQHLDQRIAGHDAGEDDRQGALEQVAGDHDRRPARAQRPQRIGAAGPPRADRAWVDPARGAGDEDADRDRARQVGDEHQADRPDHDHRVHQARSSRVEDPWSQGPPDGRSLASGDRRLGCASRRAARTIDRDDPPAQPSLGAGFAALRGTLTHGRRLLQRLRSRRARRGHRRLLGRLPGRPAGAQGRARRRGQDRRHVPPPRLHPDQGAARVGRLRRPGPPRQGLRPGRARRGRHRLRGDGRPARRRRQADVDRAQDAHRQEQGDLGRRPRPARRPGQGPRQPGGRGRDPGRRRRPRPQRDRRHPGDRVAGQVAARASSRTASAS